MDLVRYNPLRDLQRLERDLDKFWGSDWGLFPTVAEAAPLDMYEEKGNLVVAVTLPSFSKNEIKVTTNAGMLEISAEHRERAEEKGRRRYYLRESSNQYFRRVTLLEGVKADQAAASFHDGAVTITMPLVAPKTAAKTVAIT